jgi:hypothetical protein
MWIIYRKKDHSIIGLSADCEPDLDKDVALKSVVDGIVGPEPLSRYDAIQVTDRAQASTYLRAFPESLVLRETPKGKLHLAIETPKRFNLLLSCDAQEFHPVDSVPGVPADGVSFTTIKARKIDEQGEPQHGRDDNDQLYLRSDYGALFSADGKEEITSLKLKKGEAAFRLVSEKNRRVASVRVFNADSNLLDAVIRIEFI